MFCNACNLDIRFRPFDVQMGLRYLGKEGSLRSRPWGHLVSFGPKWAIARSPFKLRGQEGPGGYVPVLGRVWGRFIL